MPYLRSASNIIATSYALHCISIPAARVDSRSVLEHMRAIEDVEDEEDVEGSDAIKALIVYAE